MANAIASQTLISGPRNLILKVTFDGDGSGDESGTTLVDVSSFNTSEVRLIRVQASLVGFSMSVSWDATTDKLFMTVPDYEFNQDFTMFGGLVNNAGAGKTGDIVYNTIGLGASDHGHIILEMVKT